MKKLLLEKKKAKPLSTIEKKRTEVVGVAVIAIIGGEKENVVLDNDERKTSGAEGLLLVFVLCFLSFYVTVMYFFSSLSFCVFSCYGSLLCSLLLPSFFSPLFVLCPQYLLEEDGPLTTCWCNDDLYRSSLSLQ